MTELRSVAGPAGTVVPQGRPGPVPGQAFERPPVPVGILVNGEQVAAPDDHRVSLLDLLRDRLGLTGTKVGCDQGGCGACTVLLDGERVLSCLTLAAQCTGRSVVTIEGLTGEDALHPLQQAFIDCDGLQCGYCTPGQICSAVALLTELERGLPSYVTVDLAAATVEPSLDEIRERMSGNLCRCGAHNGIVEAIRQLVPEVGA